MASTIFFSGRVISVPGSYSEVDASGLESVGLGASGIVAVLGTAEGGRPVSSIVETKDFPRFNNPDKMVKGFRSGQLKEVAGMLFSPAKDPDILAGAQEVVAMKTNPATQSTTTLLSGVTPVLTLTSDDYGAFTSQINVEVQGGSSKGKALTIKLEGTVETVDNLGGDSLASLQYDGGTYGFNTAVMAVNDAGDITVTATRSGIGMLTGGSHITASTANAVEFAGANQTGAAASVTVTSSVVAITGLTGITAAHVGRSITTAGAATSANNGTFVIQAQGDAAGANLTTAVLVINLSAVTDGNNGSITWTISDAGIKVTVYGISGGAATRETLTHAGSATVTGTVVWDSNGVMGISLDKAAVAGTITVKNAPGGSTLVSLTAGQVSKGVLLCENAFVDNTTVAFALDSAPGSTTTITVFGKNAAGGNVQEVLVLPNSTASTPSVGSTYAELQAISVNNLAAARTLTATVRAAKTLGAVQNTILKVQSYFDGKTKLVSSSVLKGFLFTLLTGQTKFAPANFDIQAGAGTNINSPATGSFTADLYAIASWINQNSQLVSAVVLANATAVPDNTAAPVFLAGGIEGVALFAHYQAALNLLKKVRINSVVDLSGDPAVAAAVDAHCAYMGGIGRSERDGFVGLLNGGLTDVATKTQIKSQVIDINSRHIRAVSQAIERFNTNGERVEFLPPFLGAILAGAQAGSPVGTSLTFKYMNVLSLRQHSTWNPTDDAEEMINTGLCFLENKEGVGRRVVRNITTHLSSNNIAFVEGSVNNAVNFAVFNFRGNMEFAVGKRGFAGTLAAARGVAVGTLGLLVDNVVITAYRSLFLELIVDVLDVSVELAPVVPINFVKTTVHLVTIAQAA